MDFGSLLHVAQRNEHKAKREESTRYYKSSFSPPKKEVKTRTLSANIRKFLERKEEEEKKKSEQAKKKRDELLALRSQDGKAKKRVTAMLKRTKAANKSAIEDAVDDNNTAITINGPMQPDEDDYGYVSQEASVYYQKMMEKYSAAPPEKPVFSQNVTKTVHKDLKSTKDRVRLALQKEEEDEMMPHRRKRRAKQKDEDQEEEEAEQLTTKPEDATQHTQKTQHAQQASVQLKFKPKKALPPPMDFQQLLKLAEKKQFEPIKIEPRRRPEDEEDRPMTKKQKVEYLKEKEWRQRKEEEAAKLGRPPAGSVPAPSLVPSISSQLPRIPKQNGLSTQLETNKAQMGLQRLKGPVSKPPIRESTVLRSKEKVKSLSSSEPKHANIGRKVSNSNDPSGYEKNLQESMMTKLQEGKTRYVLGKEVVLRDTSSHSPSSRAPSSRAPSSRAPSSRAPDDRLSSSLPPSNQAPSSRPPSSRPPSNQLPCNLAPSNLTPNSPPSSSRPPNTRPPNSPPSSSRPPNTRSPNSPPSSSRPPNTRPPNSRPLNSRPLNSRPSNSQPPNTRPPNSRPPNSQPPNSQPPNSRPPNSRPPNSRPPNSRPPSSRPPSSRPPSSPLPRSLPANSQPPSNQFPSNQLPCNKPSGSQVPSSQPLPPVPGKDSRKQNRPNAKLLKGCKSKSQGQKVPLHSSLSVAAKVVAAKPPLSSGQMKQLMPADVRTITFPRPDVKPKQFPPSDVKRKSLKSGAKRRITDSEDEYDPEMDDFIEDGPDEEEDYSQHIREIFGYDRTKYTTVDDDECMESNFHQQMKEEYISRKMGILEDLEDIRQEKLEKKKKQIKMKKQGLV